MVSLWNIIAISSIFLVIILLIYYRLKENETADTKKNAIVYYQIGEITEEIKETITAIQNTNISELNLSKTETKKREEQKAKLYQALKYSCTGDIGYKNYLKEYIEELLQRKYTINEEKMDKLIPFRSVRELTVQDKFDILLYIYKKNYAKQGFHYLCKENGWAKEKYKAAGEEQSNTRVRQEVYYSITKEDIEAAYLRYSRPLRFIEKLDIITQRIYQNYVGHGIIDELREENSIDGIAGGVSGSTTLSFEYMEENLLENKNNPKNYFLNSSNNTSKNNSKRYDSVWVFYQGKPIHMEFMTFGSERELERVVHNLYRNNNPGWLSSLKGYMLNDTKDGDRITCTRPPFTESFSFWIRKFKSASPRTMESLFSDEGREELIQLLEYLIKGCMVIVITGEQNSGKTTLLKSLVQYIDNRYPIRTLETFFELWLSRLYPEKNIAGFRTTDRIQGSEAISLMKKTDGSVLIAGESADFVTAAKVVELSLVGTKMTISTNHAMTTKGLIEYHTNAIMSKEVGLYSDDARAEKSVVSALNFDIHMVKDTSGKRYVERITEIVSIEDDVAAMGMRGLDQMTMEECFKLWMKTQMKQSSYEAVDILRYEGGQYHMVHPLSNRTIQKLKMNMETEDYKEFLQWHRLYEAMV